MGRLLIIGCGGVAGVAIHKCCQNSKTFSEICILTGDPAHLEKLEKKATKDFEGRLSVYRSEGFYLEMMPLGVDKAYGVAKLLERLGYRRSQMVCCGDGFNDLPMIEYAGFGVAMANAPEQLKEKADYVAPSCDEDGLVDVITRFIKDW